MLAVCGDGYQQAAFVAQRALELRDEGVELNKMAVLYRSHFHALELQLELTRRNIPFTITSGIRFFEQEARGFRVIEVVRDGRPVGVQGIARDLTEPSPLAGEILTARPYAYLDDAPLEERRTQAVVGRRWPGFSSASPRLSSIGPSSTWWARSSGRGSSRSPRARSSGTWCPR